IDDRAAERLVERVDGAVPLGRPQVALAFDPDLDRGLGDDLAVLALLDEDPEALQSEERLVLLALLAQQQLEGRVGGLVVITAGLSLLPGGKRPCRPLVGER